MSAPLVQAHYDELATVAQHFGRQSQVVNGLQSSLRQSVQALEQGGWEGEGSAAFFGEMNDTVMPAVTRLSGALEAAQRIVLEIKELLEKADEEAANPFRSGGAGVVASTETGPAPTNGAPAAPSPAPATKPQSLLDSISDRLRSVNRFAVLPLFGQSLAKGRLLDLLKLGREGSPLTKLLAGSNILGAASNFLAPANVAAGIWGFAEDPSVVNGASLGASGLGLYGALASGPGALLAGAFSTGYTIGEVFVPRSWKEGLGDALADWDPLSLNASPGDYPNTTIKDYARRGQEMPVDTARSVYFGLWKQQGLKKADEFAKDYAQRNDVEIYKIATP